MMSDYHIAQINVARMLAPITDAIMVDFVAQLPPINALADGSPGFVWRLQTPEGDAISLKVYDDHKITFNMSVWKDIKSLREFAYKTAHSGVMRDRKRWFEKFDGPYCALWWLPAGHIPTLNEGKEKLEYLCKHGDTAYAFSFKNVFPMPQD